MNGVPLTYDDYKTAIARTRAQNVLSIENSRELLASRGIAETANGGGSVAYISTFTSKDRQTGHEKRELTVTLATVAVVDGRRLLTELTEVFCSA